MQVSEEENGGGFGNRERALIREKWRRLRE